MNKKMELPKAVVRKERELASSLSKAIKDLLFSLDHPDEAGFDVHYKNAKKALVDYEAYWFAKGS